MCILHSPLGWSYLNRGLLSRHGEAGHAAMFDKPVGSPVQLVWKEGGTSFWKPQAGPGSDK